MNQYATTARDYVRDHLPSRYSQISNPEEFFASLGQHIQDQVVDLTPQLAGPDPAGEDYLAKVGRLNAVKRQAEETVMADLVYSQAPENESEDLDDETAGYYADLQETLQDLRRLTSTTLYAEPTPNGGNDSGDPVGSSKNR